MSAALETLLEAARYIEQLERQRADQHTIQLHETTINSDNLNHSSHNSPYQPPINSSINNNNISNNFSVNNNNSTIRYNNVANNQLFISSPPVSPIITSNLNNILQNSNQVIHQQQRNEFNNMVNASNTIRIEARHVNNEEPFGTSVVTTNGHSNVAPPLVVISPQQQQQIHNSSGNHNNSLSPPSTSSSSFELSRSRSSSVSSTTLPPSTTPTITHNISGGHTITTNGLYQHQLQNGGDDSNQSSLNLSNVSSGYISGSSANSSIGSTNLNISGNLSNLSNGILTISEQQTLQAQSIASGGRRRTTSTNSNGGTQRSPCILRAGTREVHNKLEKNRRAHLKECFEQLKKQLPSMPEEKKTSNLSILGTAIRFVGTLKRKERELEHEMERLAKEKIAAQQKILLLKRELSAQWDHIDFSTIIPEPDVGTIREREPVNELSLGRSCPRYSSTSSLSSVATSSSPCTTIGATISSPMPTTTISTSMPSVISTTQFNNNNSNINNNQNKINSSHPIMNNNVSSPNNILVNNHNNTVSLPLTFSQQQTSKTASHHHHQMIEMSMQSLNKKNQMAINLTPDGTSALIVASNASNMPLNLNNNLSNNINVNLSNNNSKVSSPSPSTLITTSTSSTTNNLLNQSLQIISTNTHNLNSSNMIHSKNSKDITHKNGIRVAEIGRQEPLPSLMLNKELNKVEVVTTKLGDPSEPPTKVIKLMNTIALTSVDKDNKIIGSSPTTLTLQQVVGGGGLVVSPIPLLTSSQGLRVIGQAPNGIATIELSTPLGQQQARNALHNHATVCGANGPQLHKLLVSGTTSVVTQSSTTVTPELARLPGGAELNILPNNSNGTLYRSQKLAFVNNGITIKGDGTSSSRVQLVTPIQSNNSTLSGLTPIVVNQQGQGSTNIAQLIAASSSQLSGKVMTPITVSPYVVKPMVVAVASTTATSSLTTSSMSKQQTILAAPSNNNTSMNGNCI